VLLAIQGLLFFLLLYYFIRYLKQVEDRDAYSVACWAFLLLTLLVRVFVRLVFMVVSHFYFQENIKAFLQDPFRHDTSGVKCIYVTSSVLPIWFFTIAVLINLVRWFHLVHIKKNEHKEEWDPYKVARRFRTLLISACFFFTFISIIENITDCNPNISVQLDIIVFYIFSGS